MLEWSTSTPSCLFYIHTYTCIKTHTHTHGDKVRSCKVPNNSTGCAYTHVANEGDEPTGNRRGGEGGGGEGEVRPGM